MWLVPVETDTHRTAIFFNPLCYPVNQFRLQKVFFDLVVFQKKQDAALCVSLP